MKYRFQAFQSTGKDISQRRNFKPVPYAESIKYVIQENENVDGPQSYSCSVAKYITKRYLPLRSLHD